MASPVEPGVRIAGKYEIIGPLGRGAYGNVYRALQHPVERPVALKVISPHAAADEQLRARFFREARAIARLNHPGVVTLHDYGDADGLLYMVMEYVDGRELKSIIKEEGALRPRRAFDYARQILTVMVEAHQLELIHRDLKPANIMVTQDAAGVERLKILDFGIAKLLDDSKAKFQTQMGTVVGSPSYFSPEQAMGEPAGPASDQYSVGVLLYEMLTGKKPFTGTSLMALINAHRFESVPALPRELGLPPSVMSMLRRMLEKQPADRFPDARAALEALDEVVEGLRTGNSLNIVPRGDSRPTMKSDRFEPLPPPENVRRTRTTDPIPGLDPEEANRSKGPSVTRGGLVAPDTGDGQRHTAALIPLDSAHMLYTSDAATVPETRAIGRSDAPAPGEAPATIKTPPGEAPALPDVTSFKASETIIRPPEAPRRPSSTKVALLVGGIVVVLGLVGLWALSRSGSTPADEMEDAAVDAEAVDAEAVEVVDVAVPDAAPIVDAAPVVDAAAIADGAADGAASAADGGAVDAAPIIDAAAAKKAGSGVAEPPRPKPMPRRRAPKPRPKPAYEKL